jgi:hypothetical protein
VRLQRHNAVSLNDGHLTKHQLIMGQLLGLGFGLGRPQPFFHLEQHRRLRRRRDINGNITVAQGRCITEGPFAGTQLQYLIKKHIRTAYRADSLILTRKSWGLFQATISGQRRWECLPEHLSMIPFARRWKEHHTMRCIGASEVSVGHQVPRYVSEG